MIADKRERALAIAKEIIQAADRISNVFRSNPGTGKKGRNIFLKKYNRRPMSKYKRSIALMKARQIARFGIFNVHRIMATPIPKYPAGSTSYGTSGEVAGIETEFNRPAMFKRLPTIPVVGPATFNSLKCKGK